MKSVATSRERLRTAVDAAITRLSDEIRSRTANIDFPFVWVPFDGTRFYRIGGIGTDGFGLDARELEAAQHRLTKGGDFPVFAKSVRAF